MDIGIFFAFILNFISPQIGRSGGYSDAACFYAQLPCEVLPVCLKDEQLLFRHFELPMNEVSL